MPPTTFSPTSATSGFTTGLLGGALEATAATRTLVPGRTMSGASSTRSIFGTRRRSKPGNTSPTARFSITTMAWCAGAHDSRMGTGVGSEMFATSCSSGGGGSVMTSSGATPSSSTASATTGAASLATSRRAVSTCSWTWGLTSTDPSCTASNLRGGRSWGLRAMSSRSTCMATNAIPTCRTSETTAAIDAAFTCSLPKLGGRLFNVSSSMSPLPFRPKHSSDSGRQAPQQPSAALHPAPGDQTRLPHNKGSPAPTPSGHIE